MVKPSRKPLRWMGSTLDDLRAFPDEVRRVMGHALDVAQRGAKHSRATPLRGFGGAGVLEVVDDYDGNTYRAVYTVRFAGIVYGLHAFQKKAKTGISTPRQEMELVRRRLKLAKEDYAKWLAAQKQHKP